MLIGMPRPNGVHMTGSRRRTFGVVLTAEEAPA